MESHLFMWLVRKITYKADLNRCQENGWSPLLAASNFNHNALVEYLCDHSDAFANISNKEGETPLYIACENDNVDLVKLLLKHGAAISDRDENGFTSFHKACSKAVDNEDQNGQTPLHYATLNNHADTIKLLVRHGTVRDNYDIQVSPTSTGTKRRKYCVIQ
ncbi:Hypothetical predicted protein [Mytilus galloprovincialis]|uniref:Uncharacterized protein n=1 Tax=Mytilus galloprovincialis TaxID=29158 RepID=A0A8B6D115_MYTGA|nr:Hypothetical predicted protein [Mytilus galloprovincialis]